MDTRGTHLLFDVWLGDDITPELLEQVFNVIRRHFHVVREVCHHFVPQGLTAAFILSESHFTVHTYPEHRYLSVDIYVCGANTAMQEVLQELKRILKPAQYSCRVVLRGQGSWDGVTARRPTVDC